MTRHPGGEPIQPADDAGPAHRAAELFAHGLLSLVHDEADSETRIRHALVAINRDTQARRTFHFPRVRTLAAAAALLLVGVTATLVMLSTEASAQALLKASITALHAPGDRRYEARRQRWPDDALTLVTTIDSRQGGLLLVQHKAPRRGSDAVAGRDARGPWGITRAGGIDRDDPYRSLPGWAAGREPSFFTQPLDAALEELARSYALERLPPEPHPERPGPVCDRIVATKEIRGQGLRVGRIDLWIHPATHLPERIELSAFPSGENRESNTPPPPFRIVIDRADAPLFPDDWFDAERWERP